MSTHAEFQARQVGYTPMSRLVATISLMMMLSALIQTHASKSWINQTRQVGLQCVTSGQAQNQTDALWGSGADCSASWTASGTHVQLNGTQAPRMFFEDLSSPEHARLLVVDTKHESLAWTMDVSTLGGLWNGALYMVQPNFTDPKSAQWYCDANGATNGAHNYLWCGEFDLIEANTCAAHTTSHGCINPARWPYHNATISSSDVNDLCNAWGNAITFPFVQRDRPRNAIDNSIDTSRPFHVNVSFDFDGDTMAKFTTTFRQGAVTSTKSGIPFHNSHNPDLDYDFPRQFAILAQLWSAKVP